MSPTNTDNIVINIKARIYMWVLKKLKYVNIYDLCDKQLFMCKKNNLHFDKNNKNIIIIISTGGRI